VPEPIVIVDYEPEWEQSPASLPSATSTARPRRPRSGGVLRLEGDPQHHLYVVVDGNDAHRLHVGLRDHLRSHADDARAYGELKKTLASQYGDDPVGFTEAKSDFIRRLLGGGARRE
jgi:GrpB-like predicted nucleotidyltransferase (UPF0157 family)